MTTLTETQSLEKSLRKSEHLKGTWIELNNGEEWCIPALPMGKSRHKLIEQLAEVEKFKEITFTVDFLNAAVEANARFAHSLLEINYPELTYEKFEELDLVDFSHVQDFQSAIFGDSLLEDIVEKAVETVKEGNGIGEIENSPTLAQR